MLKPFAFILLALASAAVAEIPPAGADPAIHSDPPRDVAHPARMEVLHIPSGGVLMNGLAYSAAGAGPHPTMVLLHGLPGHEKNLDLAQAVRRAGWNVITFNYRGSWGSPGRFSFVGNLNDVRAVLAYVREPANAARLGIDPSRIVLAGHSMGGRLTALTAERDHGLAGAILISPVNKDRSGEQAVAFMRDNMESLAGVTAESMADERARNTAALDFLPNAAGLAETPLLVLSADDGHAAESDALVASVQAAGGKDITTVHVATDHSWSDRRIRLEEEVIKWLGRFSRQ